MIILKCKCVSNILCTQLYKLICFATEKLQNVAHQAISEHAASFWEHKKA